MLVASYIDISSPTVDALVAAFGNEEDRRAAERYRPLRRRRQGIAAHALVRAVLEREMRQPGKDWDLTCDTNGKPELSLKRGEKPIYISLSHSNSVAACAITDLGPIGIDIEHGRYDRPFEGIAAVAFGKQEQHAVAQEGRAAFYRIWTLREALAKAISLGFPKLVDGRDYFAATPASDAWRRSLDGHEWSFIHCECLSSYSMAVAVALPVSFVGTASWELWCPDGPEH
jgi:4'-phosphopantetheinyl transferase